MIVAMPVSAASRLDLGTPRGEAATELAALLAHGRDLRDRVDEVERQQRDATARAAAVSAALAELERRGLAGADVGAQRKKLEAELAKAKAEAAEPWAERISGGQQAVRDHEQQVALFVGQHFPELYGELAEDAEAATGRFNHLCNELLAAYYERMTVESRVTALNAMVRQPEPNAVFRTRAEAVAQAVNALLQGGGEAAPLLRNDPRPPRDEPAAEPEPAAA
jgi:hypothetical protein